jgi:GTP-binding protein
VESGSLKTNTTIKALARDGSELEQTRVTKLLAFRGLDREPVESVSAGDIVAIAGFAEATVADTLCDLDVAEPLAAEAIDPPTLAMTFSVNDSPLAGREGDKVTSRMIRDRLTREAEGNVALKIADTTDQGAFEVSGRGELQLAVLIEEMRREGFELSISRPRVLFQKEEGTGTTLEPIEEIVVDVDEEFSGSVVEKLGARRGELIEMRSSGGGKQRLVFHAPTRSLIGYHGEFMTDTRGTGVLNRVFYSYAPYKGDIEGRRVGTIVSRENGKAVPYALWNLEERGPLFIGPGEPVYNGMVIGEHNKGEDLEVNPLKAKQLTNFRASGKDDAVDLTPARKMTLEKAIAYIEDDELVEVTPQSIRLRKRHLDPHERKRASKQAVA